MADKRTPNMDMTVDGSLAHIAIMESVISVRVPQQPERDQHIDVPLSSPDLQCTAASVAD